MKSYQNISFANVDVNMGFWHHRQFLNRSATIYTVMNRFAETGRFDALRCNWRQGMPNRPHIFWDSDVAKWMEAVAYLIQKQPMPDLERAVEEMIDHIETNQCPDGYFNSYFTTVDPSKRWQGRGNHELYCAGHLMEAAIAWRDATGRDRFLKVMCRYADYIDQVFRVEQSAAFATPGHQEIELALVKLYRATGNEKYLNLSRWFIDHRCANEKDCNDTFLLVGQYQQDHVPCAEQTTAEGHSVRACYMYAAMADIARECGDEALKKACEAIFENIAQRRMYITAGIGSTYSGEAFTVDYDLPNESAYTETCASIALAYFAHRMLLLEPDGKYADIIERVMYNGFLASTSLDGRRFFYTNPMEIVVARRKAKGGHKFTTEWFPDTERVEVFGCSCCPPNVTRFVASVGDFIYTESDECLYVHQYVGNEAHIGNVSVRLETEYPRCGKIKLSVDGMKGRKLCLRIPQWCRKFELDCAYELANGYAQISCDEDAMTVNLELSMPVEMMQANPNVVADVGRVALMRGPVVYCMEARDNDARIFDCMLDADPSVAEIDSDEYYMPVLKVKGWQHPSPEGEWLYRPFCRVLEEKTLTFIPYYALANRGEDDMRVWVPVKY